MSPFCPGPKCEHYSTETKYPRKCFYEAQCINPILDQMAASVKTVLRGRLRKIGSWFGRG